MKHIFSLCLAATMALPALAQAQSITLTESVSQEVAQDELTARFFVQQTGRQAPELTKKVTEQLNRAFSLSTPSAKVTHTGISTQPVYDQRGRTNEYQVRASVEVRSTKVDDVSKVANKLSEFMSFESLTYSVSAENRKQTQTQLNDMVAKAFLEKATKTAKALGYLEASIDTLSLDGAQEPRPMQPMPKLMMSSRSAMDGGPLNIEQGAGTERISSTLTGTVTLKRKMLIRR